MTVRTRFAPSPTGDLHLGGAWTALASWVWARRQGGEHLLRIEDIDAPRVVRGSSARIMEDLKWLGLDWNGPALKQSDRSTLYEQAVAALGRQGLVYPCDCSRSEIARIASAPHEGEEIIYPGTCRDKPPSRAMRKTPSLRVVVPDEVVGFDDAIQGRFEHNLARDVGDFVVRRGDGAFAYHLAVVLDDIETRVTDVVRGADLLASTPRQLWLARVLGAPPPRYAHVPLVLAPDGTRLEKRTFAATIRRFREAGIAAGRIVGELAFGLGLTPENAPIKPCEIVAAASDREIPWRKESWRVPLSLVLR